MQFQYISCFENVMFESHSINISTVKIESAYHEYLHLEKKMENAYLVGTERKTVMGFDRSIDM